MTATIRRHKGEAGVVYQDNTLHLTEVRMKRWGVGGAQLLMLLVINLAHAGGLGVQGDGFLTQFSEWIPTVLFVAMLVGIAVWLQASSEYNQGVLSGSVSLVSRGVIGGGAIAILTALGFTQGAILN